MNIFAMAILEGAQFKEKSDHAIIGDTVYEKYKYNEIETNKTLFTLVSIDSHCSSCILI